ncbi:MAG: helix-turn-helix domain-containing protein [Roseovarius sp.]|jgi:transcriptional regulator with XRE-family HTH domain|nr:helix-turn-helix domain-containing protein [Roseovarius sp.]
MHSTRSFGSALKTLRRTLGISQLALASQLASTQRHVSFLETGRSQPTVGFLRRLCTELNLSAAQRGALFEASGLRNPYAQRALSSREITKALDMIERRILQNWPFPAFALDHDWAILRMNTPAAGLFASFGLDLSMAAPSLLTVILSPAFRARVHNWEEASLGLYFRLQRASERDPAIAAGFARARRDGVFDHIPTLITGQHQAPVFTALEIGPPEGPVLRMTPFVGQLATLQDARLDGLEIEFMVPLDDVSEEVLKAQH